MSERDFAVDGAIGGDSPVLSPRRLPGSSLSIMVCPTLQSPDSLPAPPLRFSGKSSQKVKEGLIVKLLAASKGNETGYVIRSLQVCQLGGGSRGAVNSIG